MRCNAWILGSLAAIAAGDAHAQYRGIAYAVDSDDSDQLWVLDLTSGQRAALGDTGFGGIEALAFHPDGRLFGIAEDTQQLVVFNLTTGAADVVGALGSEVLNPGFAIDASGAAWLASDTLQSSSQPFFSVDLLTGAATLIGELGAGIQGLTAIGQTLYGVGDEVPGLYRIDTKKGIATQVAVLGAPFTGESVSVEAAPDGTLITMNDDGAVFTTDPVTGTSAALSTTLADLESLAIPLKQICAYTVDGDISDLLYKIDLLTGAAIAIGPTGFGDLEGLAFHPDGRLFGVDEGTNELVRIDVRTGRGTAVGALGITLSGPGFAISPAGQAFVASDTATGPLHSVDLSTGTATSIGNTNEHLVGLAFLGSDLLGVTHTTDRLVRIDTSSANATVIGPLVNVSLSCGGMDVASDGTLWVLGDTGQILAVSPTSGAGVFTAETISGGEGLAIPLGCGADVFDLQVTKLDFEIEPVATAEGSETQSIDANLVVPWFSLPEDLTGFAVQLFGNDVSLSPTIGLDEKGRGKSDTGAEPAFDVALNAKKRTLSIDVTGGDVQVRNAFGLPTASGLGDKVVRVRVHLYPAIDSPNPLFVSSALIPISWETEEGVSTEGGYASKSNGPNYTGAAIATQVKAKQITDDAHDISFKGTVLPNGGGALLPRQPAIGDGGGPAAMRLKIGDADTISIPAASILVKGEGTKAKWSLDKEGPLVPGLTKLSYTASKGTLTFTLEELEEIGIPLVPIEGEALTYELPIQIDVRTDGGWQTFTMVYQLSRKDPTTGTWQ